MPAAEQVDPDEYAEALQEKLITLHERNASLVLEATAARHDAEISTLAADLLGERLISATREIPLGGSSAHRRANVESAASNQQSDE